MLNSQLKEVVDELNETTRRAHQICDPLIEDQWKMRPYQNGWSVGECLIHLNLTTEQYLPLIHSGAEAGSKSSKSGPQKLRQNLAGAMLCKILEPPYRMKVKTLPTFIPADVEAKEIVLARYESLQTQLIETIKKYAELDLNRIKIVSPFTSRVKYNLFSTFKILPCHQRRHLWQAEQTLLKLKSV